MFTPPRCPNRACREHRSPSTRFFLRHGTYHPKCRHARYRASAAGAAEGPSPARPSARTTAIDAPDLNRLLFTSIVSGVGLRQTARNLGLSYRCTQMKFRKIGRHLRHFNLNLRGPLPANSELQFDELETYEGRRNTRPLTLPMLIDRESRFIVWRSARPIRPRGRMSPRSQEGHSGRQEAIGASARPIASQRDANASPSASPHPPSPHGLPEHRREGDVSSGRAANLRRVARAARANE